MNEALSMYPKVIAHISQGDGFFIKKMDNGLLDITKKLGSSDFECYYDKKKCPISKFVGKVELFGSVDC